MSKWKVPEYRAGKLNKKQEEFYMFKTEDPEARQEKN